ncbi:serine hydrolase domain-containing protein [Streptomyces viridochromogenes]|uniref:serine hydrolase domain-containing protein n=1 Tax=Streptomyces viridochromogenes TaxID=1938 RepID=UPI00056599F2|nr:serine hydrolase domain-containing protein [Streptomyces viridochromogenes]
MTELAESCDVVGGQLAVLHRGALTTWAFGTEEYETGRPVGDHSLFAYGSVTKAFTAALLLQLVSDGDLDLDRPIGSRLPARRPAVQGVSAATPRMLLSHTAGLPSDHDDERARSLRDWYEGFLDRAGTRPAGWPARGAFSYSNVGYGIAGRLIETVTELSWWEALRSYLLEPLGTGVRLLGGTPLDPGPTPAPRGHRTRTGADGNPVVHAVPARTDAGSMAAGGLAGSATDLVRFARLHLARPADRDHTDLVDPDVLREMGRPVPGPGPYGLAHSWGAGLGLFGRPGSLWLGHDGALDGTTCHLRIRPDDGTVVALTTNSATGVRLWDALVHRLRDGGIDVGVHEPEVPPAVSAARFAECAGTYRNGDLTVDVVVASDGMTLRLPGGLSEHLVPRAGGVFSSVGTEFPATLGRFVKDRATGRIQALQYSGRTLLRELRPT